MQRPVLPKTGLFYQSSQFVIEIVKKSDGKVESSQDYYLIQVGEENEIVNRWFICASMSSPGLMFCMDTESNLFSSLNSVQAIILVDKKLFIFRDQKVERFTYFEGEVLSCLGIFDENVLIATLAGLQLVDLTCKHKHKSIQLEKGKADLHYCIIPSDDVQSRRYSLCGLHYGRLFNLFNRERREFEPFTLKDSLFSTVGPYGDINSIPYKDGKGVRSFASGKDGRLVEILFDGQILSAIDHVPWMNNIMHDDKPITPSEKHGIVFWTFSGCYSYKPSGKGQPLQKGMLKTCPLKFPYLKNMIWSDKLNACLSFEDLQFTAVPVNFETAAVVPYWTSEEIEKEIGVKNYQMEKEHPNISVITKQDILDNTYEYSIFDPFRGNAIYQIDQSAKLSGFRIIRGINCKEKFPAMCSDDYVEMESVKEFSNYLGAPLYKGEKEFFFVFEVMNNSVQIGVVHNTRSKGISWVGKNTAFGILKPVDNISELVEEPKLELNEDWLAMMESNELEIQSGKLKVIDFTTDREEESSLIGNVMNGSWTATQLIISRLVKQVLIYNNDFAKDHPEIENDWETPGNIFDEDFDLFDQEIRHGWHVSGIIGIDHGVGLIDGDKFGNSNLFKNTNQESMDWYQVVTGIMNETPSKDLIPFPFGVFSTCGEGDGAYPCLYKMHNDKVVAVKVAFSNFRAPRRNRLE